MTILKFEDQSAKDLRLNLVGGAVDKESLVVLCTGTVEEEGIYLEFGIIGASHYLEVSANSEVVFTEVFACTKVKAEDYVFFGDIERTGDCVSCSFQSIDYCFSAEVLRWDEAKDEVDALMDEVLNGVCNNTTGLIKIFPNDEAFDFDPLTLVLVGTDSQSREVFVDTIHAYPGEGNVVFTKSTLQY